MTATEFELLGPIGDLETIAVGVRIRDLDRLQRDYGRGRWKNRKGIALVRVASGRIRRVEIHWYEAHGIGKKELKIKRYLS